MTIIVWIDFMIGKQNELAIKGQLQKQTHGSLNTAISLMFAVRKSN